MMAAASVCLDEIGPGVCALTLNVPATRNALTSEMAVELARACEVLDARQEVAVTIIRGTGGFFCSGAHRDLLQEAADRGMDSEVYERFGSVYESFFRVGRLRSVTIAAVVGGAVGAGVNLMLAADLRVVARDARIVGGFGRLGIHPGGGHFVLAQRAGGREFAAAIGLLGLEISGERCQQLGVAWEAVDEADVEARAIELARGVADDPTLIRAVKETFASEVDQARGPWGAALAAERASQMWSLRRSIGP